MRGPTTCLPFGHEAHSRLYMPKGPSLSLVRQYKPKGPLSFAQRASRFVPLCFLPLAGRKADEEKETTESPLGIYSGTLFCLKGAYIAFAPSFSSSALVRPLWGRRALWAYIVGQSETATRSSSLLGPSGFSPSPKGFQKKKPT